MEVLYHNHEDPFFMEPTKIKLPGQQEYILNDQLKAWCEKFPDKHKIQPTLDFFAKSEIPTAKLV